MATGKLYLQNFTALFKQVSTGPGVEVFPVMRGFSPASHLSLPTSLLRSSPRPISTGPLNPSLNLHARPIYHVVCMGSYSLNGMGNFILRRASRLDAFSAYPFRIWVPSATAGAITGTPEIRPSRSSRTRDSASQVSCACDG